MATTAKALAGFCAIVGILTSAACGVAGVSRQTTISPDHPIIGSWRYVTPYEACVETYVFVPDGTRFYTSAQEQGQSRYEISAEPTDGFYRITDTVTQNNGLPDCGGGTVPAGDVVTLFVRFIPGQPLMVICTDESGDACIGPFVRHDESMVQ